MLLEKVIKDLLLKFVLNSNLELNSTHAKLCVPIIHRMYRKMSAGIKFTEIKVAGSLICDGHHRYIASLLANVSMDQIEGIKTSAMTITEWKAVTFHEEDWDTPAKVNILNAQDASFNNMPIQKLLELLK